MLAVDTIPLSPFSIFNCRMPILDARDQTIGFGNRQSVMSFRLFVTRVLTAAPAELLDLQPIRSRLFVLGRYVIAALTVAALQYNVLAWHYLLLRFRSQS